MPAVARIQSPDEAGDSSMKRNGDEMPRRKLTGLDEVHEEEESELAESSFAEERKVSCGSESSRRSSIDINGKKKKSSDGGLSTLDSQWEHARRMSEAGVRRMSDASIVLTEDTDSFIIGDRVWVGGTKPGQIAYIGETQFAPGEWAGVVLDEPVGKNDGSVAGIRYFQCENKRGVFSRLTRLTLKPIDEIDADELETKTSRVNISSHTQAAMSPKERVTEPNVRKVSSPTSGSSPSPPSSNLKIGERVIVMSSLGSKAGILRYKGTTDFATGEWCGVELDDPVGKNDGSVGGKRYFECQPKCGLFAPAHKVSLSPSSRRSSTCMMHRSGIPSSNIRRVGSRESMTSVATSVTSSVRSARVRLGVTSLGTSSQRSGFRTPTTVASRTPVKDVSKDLQIERLIKAQELDRQELTRAANQTDEAEQKLALFKEKYEEFQQKSEERIRELEQKLSKTEQEKVYATSLLEDEKKKAEDLVFQYEEANISMAELKMENKNLEETIQQLQQRLSEEQQKSESLEQESNKIFETEEIISRLKDELETMKSKLETLQNELSLKSACIKQLEFDNNNMSNTILKLTDDLKEAQLKLSMSEVKCRELEEMENKIRDHVGCVETSLKDARKEAENFQSRFDASQTRIENLQSELDSKIELLDNIQSTRNSEAQEFKATMDQIHSSLIMICKCLGIEVSDIYEEKTSDGVSKLLGVVENHFKQTQTRYVTELEEKSNLIAQLEKNLENKNVELEGLKSIIDSLRADYDTKTQRTEQNQKQESEDRNSEIIMLKSLSESLKNELQNKEEIIHKKEEQISDMKEKLVNSEQTITFLREEVEALKLKHQCVKHLLEITEARYDMLAHQQAKMGAAISEFVDSKNASTSLPSHVETETLNLTGPVETLDEEVVSMKSQFEKLSKIFENTLKNYTEDKSGASEEVKGLCSILEKAKEESLVNENEFKSQVEKLNVLHVNMQEKDIQIKDLNECVKKKSQEMEQIVEAHNKMKEGHSEDLSNLTKNLKSYEELMVAKNTELEGVLETSNQIKELNESLRNLVSERDQKILSLTEKQNSLLTDIESLKTKMVSTSANVSDLEQQLAKIDKERMFLLEEQTRLMKDIDAKDRSLNEASKKEAEAVHRLQETMDLEKKRFGELQVELDSAKEEILELKKRSEVLELESKGASDMISKNSELEKGLTDLKMRVDKLSSENEELMRKNGVLVTDLEKKEKEEEKLKTELLLQKTQAQRFQDCVKKLEEQIKQKQTTVVPPSSSNGESVDSYTFRQNEIDFLNTVIVDQQHKIDNLKAQIELLERRSTSSDAKELVVEGVTERQVAPRKYCDICEIFDAHETEDCPKQASDSPPSHPKHKPGLRTSPEERAYCEICEIFGHATADCDEEETF